MEAGCKGMQSLSQPLKDGDEPLTQVHTRCCIPRWTTMNEAVWSVMETKGRSSRAVIALSSAVSSHLYILPSSIHWFHTHITVVAAFLQEPQCNSMTNCFSETNHSVPFELTRLLILLPSKSTKRTCISFHVSTSFESSA